MLQASDIILKHSIAPVHYVLSHLYEWVAAAPEVTALTHRNRVVTYGKTAINRGLVVDKTKVLSLKSAEATARWAISSYKHADYVVKNTHLFLPLFTNEQSSVTIKHSGIESLWTEGDVGFLGVSPNVLDRLLSDYATRADFNTSNDDRLIFRLNENRLGSNFTGNPSNPTLQRAWYAAKRDMLRSLYTSNVTINKNSENVSLYIPTYYGTIPERVIADVKKIIETYCSAPSIDLVRQMRATILIDQANVQNTDKRMREQLSARSFSQYWDVMKSRVRAIVPSEKVSAEQFATIPLQPEGTETSRTWGIEVETVRAQLTSRPSGWSGVHDGSLNNSSSGECNCDCDSCYDSDHCDDSSNDCYYNSDNQALEFVSPILRHFNSNGLRQLCTDLPDDEDDDTPGIHVHVDAKDLTVTDVARLLSAYSIVAPLLHPLYHRQSYGYCNEMASDNIRWWLGQARKYLQATGRIPDPRDICDNQPANRYQDVNVHAMYKHGTIEFRAMGPYYNYDHLVRWAWFCREMVNVSKLGIEQNEWTKCRSLLDVIKVLRKYGSEMPITKSFDNINTSELVLAHSEE